VGLWTSHLLKTTVLWFLLAGLVLVMRLSDAIQKPDFFRRALRRTLGVAALVEFLSTVRSFPLWLEVPAQLLAVTFAMMAAVTEREPKHASVRKIANGYLTMFGVAVLYWSIANLISSWSGLDQGTTVREFLLPIWLTPIALLFVYGFAVIAAYQGSFLRMRIWEKQGPLFRQRLAIILRANIRLGYLRTLSGLAAQRIARAHGFREAWNEVGQLRQEAKDRESAEIAASRRLVENAGLVGTDDSGLQLDRREFEETRKALMWLATCHMGHYRSHGERYREDLLPIVEPHFSHDGLPENHGIEMLVAQDGQSWYGVRRTVSGWWFAIGAAEGPPDQWLYDGPDPPQGFPSEVEWDRFGGDDASKNWDEEG